MCSHSAKFAIRRVRLEDAAAIQAIYAPYVLDTAISFEYVPPTVDEMRKRIAAICHDYPYLVVEADGDVVAYAYASRHHEREAYKFDVQTAVYVASDRLGMGLGKKMYRCLLDLLRLLGYYTVYAVIVDPNERSVGLHRALGFAEIGRFPNSGYKFGRWHGVIWMGAVLADFGVPPGSPVRADDLAEDAWRSAFGRFAESFEENDNG